MIKRFDPECILIEQGSEDSIVFCPTKARDCAGDFDGGARCLKHHIP